MLKILRFAGESIARLFIVAGFAALLGACSKCDMPTWNPNRTPTSCHDDVPVR